jgi:hypothetical protein
MPNSWQFWNSSWGCSSLTPLPSWCWASLDKLSTCSTTESPRLFICYFLSTGKTIVSQTLTRSWKQRKPHHLCEAFLGTTDHHHSTELTPLFCMPSLGYRYTFNVALLYKLNYCFLSVLLISSSRLSFWVFSFWSQHLSTLLLNNTVRQAQGWMLKHDLAPLLSDLTLGDVSQSLFVSETGVMTCTWMLLEVL